ncbi:hypothetical protein HYN69_06045 [Gemmobacter aquarius]|uniref:Uncharacterized protein n=2 Tax=Paragemmobacter aquarius TaxID=2169400 RepID=A0A2S0UJZ1_9RHOB|nr:hypothetical protein HYN69_06045 [Gemmobacter aquarius]
MRWSMPQSNILQRDFGRLDTCAALQQAYDAAGWPTGTSISALREIDKRLKTGVTLIPDKGQDRWTPLTGTVISGARKPAADCDDVAVTGAQLAICAGFPADRLGLIVTQLPSRRNELHVVTFYDDPESGVWVFADTMDRMRPITQLGQTMHYFAFIDSVTIWWALRDPRTGKPVATGAPTSSLPETAAPVSPDDFAKGTCKHPHF